MNSNLARYGLTIKTMLAALASVCVLMFAVGSQTAHGAPPTAGADFNVEFNYAALTVTALGNEFDDFVLDPESKDKNDQLLGPLKFKGKYTDSTGKFKLPKASGIEFPPIKVAIGPAELDGSIALSEDVTGKYDFTTGELDLRAKIDLTIGVDDVSALPNEVQMLLPAGTTSLRCTFQGLDVPLSTTNGWPHPGKAFADKDALTGGAVAGAWTSTPEMVAEDPSQAFVCELIGSLLEPVGGLWLVNDPTETATLLTATSEKPLPGSGETPDPEPEAEAKITQVKVAPGKKTIKAGKKVKLKVRVTNKGDAAGKVTVKLNVNKKKGVKLAKKVTINVPAGKTATKAVVFKTTKKAKGKYKVTAKAAGKTGKSTITVKKAKKKKKKRK